MIPILRQEQLEYEKNTNIQGNFRIDAGIIEKIYTLVFFLFSISEIYDKSVHCCCVVIPWWRKIELFIINPSCIEFCGGILALPFIKFNTGTNHYAVDGY